MNPTFEVTNNAKVEIRKVPGGSLYIAYDLKTFTVTAMVFVPESE